MFLGIMLPLVRNGIVVVLASASGGMGAWVWPRLAASTSSPTCRP